MSSCICLGPKGSGKTHLLKALQEPDSIDETSCSPPTIGVSFYKIHFHGNKSQGGDNKVSNANVVDGKSSKRSGNKETSIQIMEVGGTMAPIWRQYFKEVKKLIYVVDTSNLCQISAAGVLLYSILTEPRLQRVNVLLVLSKMDYAYRQMRNEALLMLQMSKLQKEIPQKLTIIETSSVTRVGLDAVHDWLQNS